MSTTRIAEANMRVFGPCLGFALLLSVGLGIAAQDAPADARRSEAVAVAAAPIEQDGVGPLALNTPDTRSAAVAVPPTAAMAIAPAVESPDEMFVGTGDGSNGYWVRP